MDDKHLITRVLVVGILVYLVYREHETAIRGWIQAQLYPPAPTVPQAPTAAGLTVVRGPAPGGPPAPGYRVFGTGR